MFPLSETSVSLRKRSKSVILLSWLLNYQSWKNDLAAVHSLKTSFPQVLVVIVNGGGSKETVIQSFRSGGVDFLKKPYKKKLLTERVEALLKI